MPIQTERVLNTPVRVRGQLRIVPTRESTLSKRVKWWLRRSLTLTRKTPWLQLLRHHERWLRLKPRVKALLGSREYLKALYAGQPWKRFKLLYQRAWEKNTVNGQASLFLRKLRYKRTPTGKTKTKEAKARHRARHRAKVLEAYQSTIGRSIVQSPINQDLLTKKGI